MSTPLAGLCCHEETGIASTGLSAADERARSAMTVWRDGRFRRLFVGWSLSNFGDSALLLSLAVWAKDLTGSNSAAGLIFLLQLFPVLAAPLLGQLVDRVRRRPLLIRTNLAAAAGVLLLLLVRGPQQLWVLYAVAFGYGLVNTLSSATQSGLLRSLLPDSMLIGANAALSTADQGLRLISPLVGAGLYAAIGGGALAVMDALTFLAAALALLSVPIPESDLRSAPRQGWTRELTAGFRHLAADPLLREMTLAIAVAMLVLGFGDSVNFAVVDQGLGRGPAFFGVLMSIQGAGSVVGGLTTAWLVRRLGSLRTVGVALVTFGGGVAPAMTHSLPAVVVGFFAAGAAIPWFFITYVAARQQRTPEQLQGRVAAAGQMALNGSQTISTGSGALLVALVDYRLLIAASVVVLCATGLRLCCRRASVDRCPPPPSVSQSPSGRRPEANSAGTARSPKQQEMKG